MTVFATLAAFVLTAAVGFVVVYWTGQNTLARRRDEVRSAWATVDAELQRRHELVPLLVDAVRAAAAHERRLLDGAVAAARHAAAVHADAHAATKAESALERAVGEIVALRQRYPQLDAQQRFLDLQEELTVTEDRIAAARRYYNTTVRDYNTACHEPRGRWIARRAGFVDAEYFDA